MMIPDGLLGPMLGGVIGVIGATVGAVVGAIVTAWLRTREPSGIESGGRSLLPHLYNYADRVQGDHSSPNLGKPSITELEPEPWTTGRERPPVYPPRPSTNNDIPLEDWRSQGIPERISR